ncbi:MAG: D-amino acid dehydrogenase [Oceanococcus sp.]
MNEQFDITIVGAGLLGLASAWGLHNKGYRVQVIDAADGPATKTSFANSGMLTPSMADPWNSPGIWRKLLAWMGQDDAPILLRPGALPQYLGWGLRFLQHSSPKHHLQATHANFSLAAASLRQFQSWRETVAFNYELRTAGTLQVFRDAGEFQLAQSLMGRLLEHGLHAEVLSGIGLLDREPSLADSAAKLVGGIHYPDDETGDAHMFCREMAHWLQQQGVAFAYGVNVKHLICENRRLRALACSDGERAVQRVVLAAAGHTVALCAGTPIRLPIRPVKGYSLTVPVGSLEELPQGSVIDHHLHGAVTPLGQRLRLAGTAEMTGWDQQLRPRRLQSLWDMLASLLPRLYASLDRSMATPWAGFRPMSADGLPFIGASPVQGVYLNTGHGHLGWTQSLGSGRLLADLVCGDQPLIDPAPFRVGRA